MALLSNINLSFACKTRLCLIVPGRQEKDIFAQESFYLQGKLDEINEQDTSFLDCKHKHMMKSGAPPSESCTVWLPIEFHGFTSRFNSKGSWFYLNIFRDGMGPFNRICPILRKLEVIGTPSSEKWGSWVRFGSPSLNIRNYNI